MSADMNIYDPENLTRPPDSLWDFMPCLSNDPNELDHHKRFNGMGWRQDTIGNGMTQTIRIFAPPSYEERHPYSCNDAALRAYRRFNAECKAKEAEEAE